MTHDEARDLRTGGRWTGLQRLKNDILWLVASAALAGTSSLSPVALRALGRTLGRTAYGLAPGARRTALRNVTRVFPELDLTARRALVRRCFATLGETLGETVALLAGAALPPLPLSAEARSTLAAARDEGHGVVFASAHLGPWERVAASLVAAGVPLVALGRESYDPRFSEVYSRLRQAHGVRVIWRGGPGAAARILRTLRAGDVLGIPMDLSSRVASCQAPFLGHLAATPVGPARIALRARAPVVVGSVAPGPREAQLEITATRIETADLRPDDEGAHELTARINAQLSSRILALPHAWVWMHDRWS